MTGLHQVAPLHGKLFFRPTAVIGNGLQLQLPLRHALGHLDLGLPQALQVSSGALLLTLGARTLPVDAGEILIHLRQLIL